MQFMSTSSLLYLILAAFFTPGAAVAQLRIDAEFTGDRQTISLSVVGDTDTSQRVELSSGLNSWALFDASQGPAMWSSVVEVDPGNTQRYFRLIQEIPPVIANHKSWKERINFPDDSFRSDPISQSVIAASGIEIRWIKFAIILSDLPTV